MSVASVKGKLNETVLFHVVCLDLDFSVFENSEIAC